MTASPGAPGRYRIRRIVLASRAFFSWSVRSRAFRAGFSIVASVALLALTLLYLDWGQLVRALRGISWAWAGVMFGALLGYQALRTARTAILIGNRRPWHLFNTLCIQSFLNMSLPLGLGDLALIYLIRVRHDVPSHLSAASVIFARYIDLGLLCGAYFIGFALAWRVWPWQAALVIAALGTALLIAGLAFAALLRWGAWPGWRRLPLPDALRRHALAFREAMRAVSARHRLWPAVLCSAAMWADLYFFFYGAIRALGYDFSFLSMLQLFVLLDLVAFLPVKGIANVGSHHASWFFALRILRMDAADATVLAFGTHLLFTASFVAIAGIPGLDALGRRAVQAARNAAQPIRF